jgi:hypothetical protein
MELLTVWASGRRVMLTAEYLRYHIDALLRLSRDTKDPAVSTRLQEMADELRIIVSVTEIAEIAGMAADLKGRDIPAVPSRLPPRPADIMPFKRRVPLGAPPRLRSRS